MIPSAAGSAYFEWESPINSAHDLSSLPVASLKISCAVHGPRPSIYPGALTPSVILSTNIKFAPFATKQYPGRSHDSMARDIGIHLETALRGAIIGDRWPKSGIDVAITVLEIDEVKCHTHQSGTQPGIFGTVGHLCMMSILSGCITVASAAIVDAGIDCIGVVSGGDAAIFIPSFISTEILGTNSNTHDERNEQVVLDPFRGDHMGTIVICMVGYLGSCDEITALWVKDAFRNSLSLNFNEIQKFKFIINAANHTIINIQSKLTRISKY